MTLHDLSSNVKLEIIEKLLEINENKIREILKSEDLLSGVIRLKTYCITN